MSATGMENLEGAESTHNTKVSDSAYSNSCSNSQSQRSGSSKSRHSGSNSSGSSGYGGKASTQASSIAPLPQPTIKRTKEKDRKKKKLKMNTEILVTVVEHRSTASNLPTAEGVAAGKSGEQNDSQGNEPEKTVAGATSNIGSSCDRGSAAGQGGPGGNQQVAQDGEANSHHGMGSGVSTGNTAEEIGNEEKANEDGKQKVQERRQDGNSSEGTCQQKKLVAQNILAGSGSLPAGVASIVNSIAAGGSSTSLVRLSDQQQQKQQQGQTLQKQQQSKVEQMNVDSNEQQQQQQQTQQQQQQEQQQQQHQQQQPGVQTQKQQPAGHQPKAADQQQAQS